jgi:hypothetical protein
MIKTPENNPPEGKPPFSNNTLFEVKKWSSTDTRGKYEKNTLTPSGRLKMQKNGYDENSITYNSDKHGLRNDPNIDWSSLDKPIIMSLGCSYTEGIGLREEEIWASVLSKKMGCKLFNAGVAGGSADNAFRIARELIPLYKPYAVFHLVTHTSRLEILSQEQIDCNTAWQFGPWDMDGHYAEYSKVVTSDLALQLQQERNRLAIAHICHINNVKYIDCEYDEIMPEVRKLSSPYDDRARDLAHPGRNCHNKIADIMYDLYNGLPELKDELY